MRAARLNDVSADCRGAKAHASLPACESHAATILPPALGEVALIDGATCAAVGMMSVSWWHAEVATGSAPKPAIRAPRCTRWRLTEVRAFWEARAEQGSGDSDKMLAKAKHASAAAQAKRRAQAPSVGA